MAAWTVRSVGAAAPVRSAISTTAVTMASSSSCLPASRSCSMEVLWCPTFSAPRNRFSIEMSGVAPTLAAMSSVSSISWITSCRVLGCSQIWTIVALVSALSGLKATLPISLIQMSLRRSASTGAFSPPAIIASLNAIQRCEISPDGSPIENRVPSRCRITPGASMVVAGYTTQPMARSGDSTAVVAPPGSTASTGARDRACQVRGSTTTGSRSAQPRPRCARRAVDSPGGRRTDSCAPSVRGRRSRPARSRLDHPWRVGTPRSRRVH